MARLLERLRCVCVRALTGSDLCKFLVKKMLSSLFTATVLGLHIGTIHPTSSFDGPSDQLLRAARGGDVVAVRRVFLQHKMHLLDLNTALDAAAASSHMNVVDLLVNMGATDLNSALLSAAAKDNARMVCYLLSTSRASPASNAQEAQTLASNFGMTNAEWALTAYLHRARQGEEE